MTPDQIVNNVNRFQISVTDTLKGAGFHIATSGVNKGKLVNGSKIPDTGTGVVIVSLPQYGKTASTNITVREERAITQVISPTGISNNLLQGADYEFGFLFKDQYGETIKAQNNTKLTYKVLMDKVSGTDNAIEVYVGGQNGTKVDPKTGYAPTAGDESDLGNVYVKAANDVSGSYRVTVQLIEGTTVVSQQSVTFNNVAATGALTYNVADLPVLYKGASTAGDPYAVKLELTAKDAQGNSYVINKGDIVSVTSNIDGVTYSNGSLYVAQAKANAITKDTSGIVTVVFNTRDEVKTISKDLTVSVAAPAPQKFDLVNKALENAKIPEGATVAALSGTLNGNVFTLDNLDEGQAIYLVAHDQYGNAYVPSVGNDQPVKVQVSNVIGLTGTPTVTIADGETPGVAKGVLSISGVTFKSGVKDGSFRIVATATNGKVGTFTVNVKDVTPTPPAQGQGGAS
jgi:hypothetical protein